MNFKALFKHDIKVVYWGINILEISYGIILSLPFLVLLLYLHFFFFLISKCKETEKYDFSQVKPKLSKPQRSCAVLFLRVPTIASAVVKENFIFVLLCVFALVGCKPAI